MRQNKELKAPNTISDYRIIPAKNFHPLSRQTVKLFLRDPLAFFSLCGEGARRTSLC
jgi:hypothetical protein